jgi:hypothetical protein
LVRVGAREVPAAAEESVGPDQRGDGEAVGEKPSRGPVRAGGADDDEGNEER